MQMLFAGCCTLFSYFELPAQSSDHQSAFFELSGVIEGLSDSDQLILRFQSPRKLSFIDNDAPRFYNTTLDKTGAFRYKLPADESLYTISLEKRWDERFYFLNFIAFPGDSVNLQVNKQGDKQTIHFSGRGIAKYRCKEAISKIYEEMQDQLDEKLKNYSSFNFNSFMKEDHYLFFNRSMKILEKYRPALPINVYQRIKADIIGDTRMVILEDLLISYSKSDIKQKKELSKWYVRFNIPVYNIPDSILASSESYIQYLWATISVSLTLNHGDDQKFGTEDYYTEIKKNFSGLVRDKILIFLYFSGNPFFNKTEFSRDSCFVDALDWLRDPVFYKFLQNQLQIAKKGKAVFPFELEDMHGKMINLKDLHGKIVLLDVWYTGCSGCGRYAEELEKNIYPVFAKDTNIIFLSICGDRDKKTWLKSIETNRYTRKENLNVSTGELAFNHPFLKYYGFNGGPYSMIIDRRGNIFAFEPPKIDMDSLKRLIYEALSEP